MIRPISWLKGRLRSWLADDATLPKTGPAFAGRTIYGSLPERETLTEKQAKYTEANEVLKKSLMGIGPGWWSSDHAEEATHFTSWNYCAIHAKAKQAAQATMRVYRRKKKKGNGELVEKQTGPDQPEPDREPLENHPAAKLLEKPNPRWPRSIFMYQISQQLNLTGSALPWINLDRIGRPAELWVIPTALARPQMPSAQMPEGAYWVTATGLFTMTGNVPTALGVGAMAGLTIDARDVQPIRWPHPVLLADGQSPLAAGSVQIDLAEEIDQAAWAVMHNSVDPSVVLSLDPSMQVDEAELNRIEAMIEAKRGGTGGKGKHWIIQGCTPAQVHRSPSELDYANSRPQCRDGVLAIQGTPAIAAGIPSDTGTYSAYYVSLKQFIELCVQPELDMIAAEFTRMIQRLYDDDALEVEITAKSFDDPEVIDRRLSTAATAGNLMTVKEARALLNLPPFNDERDDEFFGQKVSVRATVEDDTDPGLPGVQIGENEEADDSDTGTKKKPDLRARGVGMTKKMNAFMLNGYGGRHG